MDASEPGGGGAVAYRSTEALWGRSFERRPYLCQGCGHELGDHRPGCVRCTEGCPRYVSGAKPVETLWSSPTATRKAMLLWVAGDEIRPGGVVCHLESGEVEITATMRGSCEYPERAGRAEDGQEAPSAAVVASEVLVSPAGRQGRI